MENSRGWRGVVLLIASLGCGSGDWPEQRGHSLQSRLPASNEIGSWKLAEPPLLINTDTALYNQIDGAAPKYVDRGWVATLYATYQQGSSSIQVAIHDMGTPYGAVSMFNYDLPVSRIEINKIPDPSDPSAQIANAVIDMGLAASYLAIAYDDRFYIEVNIDDRSDAALVYVKTFALKILKR
jgi:hypothetical protein